MLCHMICNQMYLAFELGRKFKDLPQHYIYVWTLILITFCCAVPMYECHARNIEIVFDLMYVIWSKIDAIHRKLDFF